ncbi:cob(I)yrinic acid a,c-diamide adenosyltransferase [Cellulomonas carbonis]|uniref:Corrinoid adenosyltransferase n=1 Tax=Cellulomonas carbonis T26 TaxID=947969 RepID=A0A0A0BTP2_9CELL|nr:cob(I)yrinic acid a,c-diamide adenosyltransferase [Cellulomonas carbonis]KGM11748.1 cob(I)yrinic acid a c-diamide adenosyltransferase [Cellulomonas carbonis T26]GGB94690.1 ATP:cob(I)alamin adenosyltransferase [Cellulomonas carbonis]
MRIYTRAGDDGSTGLFLGSRVSKADVLVDACGDVDEAVSVLGVARATCDDERLATLLLGLQRELFVVAADLATNPAHRDRLRPGVSTVTEEMVEGLERLVDTLVAERPLRPVFIVPGATAASATVDHARSVVRRAERHVVLAEQEGHVVSALVLRYLNRLSDLLFVVARHAAGDAEEPASHD